MQQSANIIDPKLEEEGPATAFYRQHAPLILAYLRQKAPSPEEAEDLLLEVFLAALEYPEILQRAEGQQRAWLRQVARNKLADLYRARHRHVPHVVPLEEVSETLYEDEYRSPEQSAIRGEEQARVARVLQRIPENQQQVLRLRFVYGLRSTEIATILGKRDGTVRMLLSRALSLFRRLYEKE